MFQRNGSFKKNKINLAEKASKAMYDILNKGRVHTLSVSVLDLVFVLQMGSKFYLK
jgi:hypothetical protein